MGTGPDKALDTCSRVLVHRKQCVQVSTMPSTCETAHLGDTPPFLVFKSILDISVDVVAFWVLGIFRGQFTLFAIVRLQWVDLVTTGSLCQREGDLRPPEAVHR